VLDHSTDHGLVELIRDLGPGHLRARVGDRIAAALGRGREGPIPQLATSLTVRVEAPPELDVEKGLEPVRRDRLAEPHETSQLVELHPQSSVRVDAPLVQEMPDRLLLERRLAHLPCASKDDGRRPMDIEPPKQG
jgi:hypothetical protein